MSDFRKLLKRCCKIAIDSKIGAQETADQALQRVAAENTEIRGHLTATLGIRGWEVRPRLTSSGEQIATYGSNGYRAYLFITNRYTYIEVEALATRKEDNPFGSVSTLYKQIEVRRDLQSALECIKSKGIMLEDYVNNPYRTAEVRKIA